jgi:hypothetical protein
MSLLLFSKSASVIAKQIDYFIELFICYLSTNKSLNVIANFSKSASVVAKQLKYCYMYNYLGTTQDLKFKVILIERLQIQCMVYTVHEL